MYPESYEFSRERIKLTFSNEEKYELIIKRLSHSGKFLFIFSMTIYNVEHLRNIVICFIIVVKDDHSEETELTDNERLNIFHNRLLDKTKTYHEVCILIFYC